MLSNTLTRTAKRTGFHSLRIQALLLHLGLTIHLLQLLAQDQVAVRVHVLSNITLSNRLCLIQGALQSKILCLLSGQELIACVSAAQDICCLAQSGSTRGDILAARSQVGLVCADACLTLFDGFCLLWGHCRDLVVGQSGSSQRFG